jgi:hypothetical protein
MIIKSAGPGGFFGEQAYLESEIIFSQSAYVIFSHRILLFALFFLYPAREEDFQEIFRFLPAVLLHLCYS